MSGRQLGTPRIDQEMLRAVKIVKISRRKHSQRGIAMRQSHRLDFDRKSQSSQLLAAHRLATQAGHWNLEPLTTTGGSTRRR